MSGVMRLTDGAHLHGVTLVDVEFVAPLGARLTLTECHLTGCDLTRVANIEIIRSVLIGCRISPLEPYRVM